MIRSFHRIAAVLLLTSHLSLLSCRVSLSPLQNKIAVGEEPFAIFAAEANGEQSDLYAVSAAGGTVVQVTFTRLDETSPALNPTGTVLAFMRTRSAANPQSRSVWVLNLISGDERRMTKPGAEVVPDRFAWSGEGDVLYLATREGMYRVPAPPADPAVSPVHEAERARADSSMMVRLGDPVFAQVLDCRAGDAAPSSRAICVENVHGDQHLLAADARDPVRWGADSVAYFVGDELVIRPLGAGHTRRLKLKGSFSNPRTATFFPGKQ